MSQDACVIRRRIGLGATLAVAALAASGALASQAAEGPRLAIARFSVYPKAWSELSTVGPDGGRALRLSGGSGSSVTIPVEQRPSWSPDGRLLAFRGTRGEKGPEVFVVGADGLGLHRLPGTSTDNDPVFMPNGHEVAFARLKRLSGQFERPSGSRRELKVRFAIWAADVEDGSLRPLTPWGRLPMTPMSFSPDGAAIAVIAPGANGRPDALAVRLDGSGATLLAHDAQEAVYSPDGGSVAFVRFRERRKNGRGRRGLEATADLYVTHADGSHLRRLTHNPRLIERWPSWDPSGQRLAFTRFNGGGRWSLYLPRPGNSLMQINADGSCATRVLSAPGQILYGSAWQPGPGREAGRIAC